MGYFDRNKEDYYKHNAWVPAPERQMKFPITKEMIEQIKEDIRIGDMISLRHNEAVELTKREYRTWVVTAKYEHYMLLEREGKAGKIRRCLGYIDNYIRQKEEELCYR